MDPKIVKQGKMLQKTIQNKFRGIFDESAATPGKMPVDSNLPQLLTGRQQIEEAEVNHMVPRFKAQRQRDVQIKKSRQSQKMSISLASKKGTANIVRNARNSVVVQGNYE